MKSFADWTQELAESVGGVQHHWETRKEAEIRGMDFGTDETMSWQIAAPHPIVAPPPPSPVAARCGQCSRNDVPIGIWTSPIQGTYTASAIFAEHTTNSLR